ncbi:MAG TPA: hypothetical protein VHC69_21880 [Polyangiaceae bacterium]|nr:hypothetical protein [Polyangiaceae bacterium]
MGRGIVALAATLCANAHAAGALPGNLAQELAVFDGNGAGDRDGRVEWPDLNPDTIATRIASGDTEGAALRGALVAVSAALGASCLREGSAISPDDVRCVLAALAPTDAVAFEYLGSRVGAVRTDSLRGIHDGADPKVDENWTFADLVLSGLGVPHDARVQSGFEDGFPVDPDEVERWSPAYLGLTTALAGDMLRGDRFADAGSPNARVSIRGRTSATLHEAVSSPAELKDFRAPGMLFMRGERLDPSTSLVEDGVRFIQKQAKGGRGGFFLSTYGANDLFSFHQIVIGAVSRTPADFEADLRSLDEETKPLTALGVRRIYLVPPPVDKVFEEHVLPAGARFTDGALVPKGSVTLQHWWLAARSGRRLPRQVVLSASDLAELHARQDAFAASAKTILGAKSNWLVIDTRDLFRHLFDLVYAGELTVDRVAGYGTLRYGGETALLSTDGVHPTELGYLLWAEMVLEELQESGIVVKEGTPVEPWRARGMEEKTSAILERTRRHVRERPWFFRPHRFPADPRFAPRIEALRADARVFDDCDPAAWAAAYRDSSWIWPFVPYDMLTETVRRIDPSLAADASLHDVLVGRVRRILEATSSWTDERRAAYRDLLRDFVDDGESATVKHAQLARATLSALARPDDDTASEFRGRTPGLFGGRGDVTFAGEFVARTLNAEQRDVLWAGGFVDWVPLRTPLSYAPLGPLTFTTIGLFGAGVAATFPFSPVPGEAKAYVEGALTLAPFTFYADDAPNLAFGLDVLQWRPAFAFGEPCQAFESRCRSLGRFSQAAKLSWWWHRDPAFGADRWPALFAGARLDEAWTSGPLGHFVFEGFGGVSASF